METRGFRRVLPLRPVRTRKRETLFHCAPEIFVELHEPLADRIRYRSSRCFTLQVARQFGFIRQKKWNLGIVLFHPDPNLR